MRVRLLLFNMHVYMLISSIIEGRHHRYQNLGNGMKQIPHRVKGLRLYLAKWKKRRTMCALISTFQNPIIIIRVNMEVLLGNSKVCINFTVNKRHSINIIINNVRIYFQCNCFLFLNHAGMGLFIFAWKELICSELGMNLKSLSLIRLKYNFIFIYTSYLIHPHC